MSVCLAIAMWTSIWRLAAQPAVGPSVAAEQRRVHAHPGVATVDVSADGRFVAFESHAGLVPDDTNDLSDVYVLDRSTGRVTLESVAIDAGAADGTSGYPRLSGDGRLVVFDSIARNLVGQSATRGPAQVYLRDRVAGLTRRVSETPDGRPGNSASGAPEISEDGRVVVFHSSATNLLEGEPDPNGAARDVYLFDVAAHSLARISVDGSGRASPSGASFDPSVGGEGSVVAFTSTAPLEAAVHVRARSGSQPSALRAAVFVRDVRAATTVLVSRSVEGRRPNNSSFSPAISADGRRVAFTSAATDLGLRDRNRATDVYLHDLRSEETTLVSGGARGGAADGPSGHPAISADGRYVAFTSEASDLLCASRCSAERCDHNLVSDIYVADAESGSMARLSRGSAIEENWWEASLGAALDSSGRIAVFSSLHPRGAADLAFDFDLFLRVLSPRWDDAHLVGRR